jgi:hypothetical protein
MLRVSGSRARGARDATAIAVGAEIGETRRREEERALEIVAARASRGLKGRVDPGTRRVSEVWRFVLPDPLVPSGDRP